MPQTGAMQIDLLDKVNKPLFKFGWNDYDPKAAEFEVVFPKPFAAPPVVMLALTEIQTDLILSVGDISTNPFTNLQIKTSDISAERFFIILTVRRTNTVGLITASWLALES